MSGQCRFNLFKFDFFCLRMANFSLLTQFHVHRQRDFFFVSEIYTCVGGVQQAHRGVCIRSDTDGSLFPGQRTPRPCHAQAVIFGILDPPEVNFTV